MKNYNLKIILITSIIFCAVLIIPKSSLAITINATSCSQADVQGAINSASYGDTVIIPSGNCTWSSSVVITNKSLTLQGQAPEPPAQGSATPTTVITDAVNGDNPALLANNAEGYPITLKNIKWIGSTGIGGTVTITGSVKDFRLTNCYFDWTGSYGLRLANNVNGVVDHCTFYPSSGTTGSAIYVSSDSVANAYVRPSSIGTANMIFVEDSIIYRTIYSGGSHAIWAQQGGSYVFRYNAVTNWEVDFHGHCSWEGGREFEIYNNIFTSNGASVGSWVVIRGGTGVIFNNIVTSVVGRPLNSIQMYEQQITQGTICNAGVGGSCPCGTYPCTHQIGRGTNDNSDPVYIWDNTYNNGEGDIVGYWPTSAQSACLSKWGGDLATYPTSFILENRDYFIASKPGYTSYTYPHPLTVVAPSDTTPPAPPGGVTVQ